MHRHLLIFKDLDSPRDKRKKARAKKKAERKLVKDSTSNAKNIDTTSTGEHHATYYEVDGEVLDEEGNEFVDEKEQKRRKKLKKKEEKRKAKEEKRKAKLARKGKLTEDELIGAEDEEDNEYVGLTEEEYKQKLLDEANEKSKEDSTVHAYNEKDLEKQLKKEDQAAKKAERKEERRARRNKKGESDFTKLYRSRVTKWWRRNQNPKTGKYWRRKKNKTRVG